MPTERRFRIGGPFRGRGIDSRFRSISYSRTFRSTIPNSHRHHSRQSLRIRKFHFGTLPPIPPMFSERVGKWCGLLALAKTRFPGVCSLLKIRGLLASQILLFLRLRVGASIRTALKRYITTKILVCQGRFWGWNASRRQLVGDVSGWARLNLNPAILETIAATGWRSGENQQKRRIWGAREGATDYFGQAEKITLRR